MSNEAALTPAHGSALGLAVHAIMQNLGGDAALVDAHGDDQITQGRLAKIDSEFISVEQKPDAVANLAHTFAVFRVATDGGERFKLSPERCLFLLIDQRPKGWYVQLMQDPAGWWDDFIGACSRRA